MEPLRTGKLQVPSLVDALYAEMRERILTADIPAGVPLTEMGIASSYSVARPTAKAAMERLVHEGLLHRETNKSAQVPVLGRDAIEDLFFTRAMLERAVVAVCAERSLVPSAAKSSIEGMFAIGREFDPAGVVRHDIGFHKSLVDGLSSPRLSRLYESIIGEVRLCMGQVQVHRLLRPETIAREHQEVMSAIETGDRERAVTAIDRHLNGARSRLVAHIEKSETPALGPERSRLADDQD
jgi:DNA-binding GntR family transcriptional regulator